MKFILFFALFLTLGLSINSQEDDSECHKKWKQFNDEIKAVLCKPDTTDDTIVSALVGCRKQSNDDSDSAPKKENGKMYEQCGTPNEDDIKGYTKVDLKNDKNKKLLMGYCSDKMHTCFQTKMKEMKESGQIKKPEKGDKPKMTDQQMDEIKSCMKKALKLQN